MLALAERQKFQLFIDMPLLRICLESCDYMYMVPCQPFGTAA